MSRSTEFQLLCPPDGRQGETGVWCSLLLPGSVEWLTCQARWAPSLNYHPDGSHPGAVPTQAPLAAHCALGNALPRVLTESTWGSGSAGSSSDWSSRSCPGQVLLTSSRKRSKDVQGAKVRGTRMSLKGGTPHLGTCTSILKSLGNKTDWISVQYLENVDEHIF